MCATDAARGSSPGCRATREPARGGLWFPAEGISSGVNFYTRKRSTPAVPIISLIDILAILLIFFIATTTFKKRESLVNVALPQSSEMEASADTRPRVALILTKDEKIALGDQPLTLEGLPEALRRHKAANPEGKLELKADQEVPIGLLVKVWDAASQAEVKLDGIPLRIPLQPGGG